jgi:hypothetical protein
MYAFGTMFEQPTLLSLYREWLESEEAIPERCPAWGLDIPLPDGGYIDGPWWSGPPQSVGSFLRSIEEPTRRQSA